VRDAHDRAKVEGQVRLLAGTSARHDAGARRPGDRLQPGLKWVRLPPASLSKAIHHVIEAERTKLRHGGLNLVRAAFRGYAALPPPSKPMDRPWEVLGVQPNATVEQIEAAYRQKARKAHPDAPGGSGEAMQVLNVAKRLRRGRRRGITRPAQGPLPSVLYGPRKVGETVFDALTTGGQSPRGQSVPTNSRP
jgi:hypothetical protein